MKTFIKKGASLVGLVAAAVVGAAALAPTASAAGGTHHVVTTVDWAGTPCIDIWSGLYSTLTTHCGGVAQFEEWRTSGDIGLDPEMSGADWISCNIWVDGVRWHYDRTYRGSGHEVTCMVTL
jgi:hypothetical protein